MKECSVRFNHKTKKVDVFRKNNSLIRSVKVVNGGVSNLDMNEIARALYIANNPRKIEELEYEIVYWDRFEREKMRQ